MKISEFQELLKSLENLEIFLPDGHLIPAHFHITEAGLNTRHFVDCGGTERLEKSVNFQLWVANDLDHRLSPSKLLGIIRKAAVLWEGEDLVVEMEYQADTIARYGLIERDGKLMLTCLQTACLAQDQCGVPAVKTKLNLKDLVTTGGCCTPGGGCC